MTAHVVVIAGGGPTGLMLAGELALAEADVAIVERRASQELDGTRAGGLHARTIEVLDQRGIAVIRVIEDQITTLRPYNARYTGDPRSIFRKRYMEMITRVSLDRFLAEGQAMQIQDFAWIPLDISDFPARHNYLGEADVSAPC
jgi:3-(3-hydroxy-phenyl)propionate hydroxylase